MAQSSTILLIGATGMLGRALVPLLRERGELLTPRRDLIDLANPVPIRAAVRSMRPGVIVNCAAWTDVDGAEANEAAATVVNADSVRELARAAGDIGATLLTFGTDYVFRGVATSPYRTNEPRAPVNAYGRSTALGEEYLESARDCRWLHVRTSWLYAPWGKNFVRTIAGLLRSKPSISVVNDQRGRPTSSEHLARTSLALLDQDAAGHWHATDGGECSWFEFAQEIGRLTGATGVVSPCSSEQFPRPAKRPAYSVLDISRTESLVGQMPAWQHNLAAVINRLE
jgi:dTDP-4-dehydrorhamnose reductase